MANMLGRQETGGKWPWWCCGPATYKIRRIMRKREKRTWKKEWGQ